MSLQDLSRREVKTRLGVVPLWSRPDIFPSSKPLVLGVPGVFAGPDDLSRLPEVVGDMVDAALVRLPGFGAPVLKDGSLAAFAHALDEVITQLFADRPVILLGVSIGAVAALATRAPAVRRIVAVEPILAAGELWPIAAPIRGHLGSLPPGAPGHQLLRQHFGVTPKDHAPRDHSQVLEGLEVPTDVILGGLPLEPERPVKGVPSLVPQAVRARLAAHPQVRLHLARNVGHNVQTQDGKLLKELLQEAARRVAAEPARDQAGFDEALTEAVPLTAERLAHWGPGGQAFAAAYLAWNPNCAVDVLGEDPAASVPEETSLDAVVLGAPPSAEVLARLAAALRPGGDLVARWVGASADVANTLASHGLQLGPPVDAAGTGVLRARKGGYAAPPMKIDTVAFARTLMDVRTRLPVRGLRSDPELIVEYALPPHTPEPLPIEAPKVLVLQRQGAGTRAAAPGQFAYAIARGWLLVIEYDDHPGLVAEALGRPYDEAELDRFACAHAVQTSTERLADLFRQANPEVRVFGNAVFELAPAPRGESPKRVFYGAVSRGDFGVAVARSLASVTAEFPDVEFVVLGDRAVFDALPTANKRFYDYLPYEAYLARMAECAVSLSPLEPLPMREMKSDAKFLDAARAGVATIGSPLIYDQTIRHGENGLLAAGLEDWAPLLRQALADPQATRAMGLRAWDYVRAERMFARQVPERRDWYRNLWARRDALNAAALARVPGLAELVAAQRAQIGA